MEIKVYSKPSCVQCTATYRAFNKLGLAYKVVDLSKDKNALNYMMKRGYRSAPIVEIDGEFWTGFRPDLITKAASRVS